MWGGGVGAGMLGHTSLPQMSRQRKARPQADPAYWSDAPSRLTALLCRPTAASDEQTGPRQKAPQRTELGQIRKGLNWRCQFCC